MKRRAITGIGMSGQRQIFRILRQIKAEDQALRIMEAEDEMVRAKSLTIQKLSTLLAEEGIELREGHVYVPLSWVAVVRRPNLKNSLALIPRAR